MPWTIGIIIKSCKNNMKRRDKIILKLKLVLKPNMVLKNQNI